VVKYLLVLLFALPAFARSVTWKDAVFSVDVPKDWKVVNDLYGIPVTLLGPSVAPKPRAVIQVIPTNNSAVKVQASDVEKFDQQYVEGRKKWLAEQNGTLLEFRKTNFDVRADKTPMLSAGVSYQLNQKHYLEHTHYIGCPGRLYHLKLILNFENLGSLKEGEKIIRSFACGK